MDVRIALAFVVGVLVGMLIPAVFEKDETPVAAKAPVAASEAASPALTDVPQTEHANAAASVYESSVPSSTELEAKSLPDAEQAITELTDLGAEPDSQADEENNAVSIDAADEELAYQLGESVLQHQYQIYGASIADRTVTCLQKQCDVRILLYSGAQAFTRSLMETFDEDGWVTILYDFSPTSGGAMSVGITLEPRDPIVEVESEALRE